MWRCWPLLSWAFRRPVSGNQRKGTKRGHRAPKAGGPTRDALGMVIPEARLRHHGPSLDAFDRAIEESARDVLGLSTESDAAPMPPFSTCYGAHLDRRDVRFQGRAGDVRQFAELAARSMDTRTAAPPNAIAFVRKTFTDKQTPQGLPESPAPAPKGLVTSASGNAVLRRALRGSAMGTATPSPSTAAVETLRSPMGIPKHLAPAVSEARRRVERRMRRLSRAAIRNGPLHPCLHQGGCPSHSRSSLCPFAQHPAAMCAVWLRDGHCDAAIAGRCPFWHGSVASTTRGKLTEHHSLFPTEVDMAGMAALLQMFVDAAVAAVEDAGMQHMLCEESKDKDTDTHHKGNGQSIEGSVHVSAVLCAALQVSATELPVHYNASFGILSASRELAVSALAADIIPDNCAAECYVHTDGQRQQQQRQHQKEEKNREKEKEEEEEEEEEDSHNDEEPQALDEEKRLCRVLDAFRVYAVVHDTFVSLTPDVTRWVLSRVQEHFYPSTDNKKTESPAAYDAHALLREASIALLRCQLMDCNIISCCGSAPAGALAHRWAALSLLQHMTLLAHCRSGAGASLLFTALQRAAEPSGPAARRVTAHAQFLRCWSFAQTVLSVVAQFILRANMSGEGFFTLTRAALLTVTRQIAQDMELRFAGPLLRAAGWAPWTDAQMFAQQSHCTVYNAVSYAHTHQPLVAPAFVVFALNVFLLHALRPAAPWTNGPVSCAFFGPPPHTVCQRQQHRAALSLPPASLRAALALLSALQDEHATGESVREGLRSDFVARRHAYMHHCAAEERRQRPRTRRYGRLPSLEELAAISSNESNMEEEGNSTSTSSTSSTSTSTSSNSSSSAVSALLPEGSAAVAPDAVARLIAALRCGRAPFRALRVAAAAMRAGRLLRRAAAKRTAEPYGSKSGSPRGSVAQRSLGLHLCVDAAVAAEAVRAGLRVGAAGERLARIAADDCFRGAIMELAHGRCFAVPSEAAVAHLYVSEESGAVALRTIVGIATGRKEWSRIEGRGAAQKKKEEVAQANAAATVRPNAKFLEILVALTPGIDREAHGRYERYAILNPRVFVSDRVLIAQQYHAAQHNFTRAGEIAAAIWNDAVRAGEIALDSRAVHAALVSELYRLPALGQNINALSGGGLSPLRDTWAPRTVADVREHLEGSRRSGSQSNNNNNGIRSGGPSFTPHADPSQSATRSLHPQNGMSAAMSGGYASYIQRCVSSASDPSRLRWAVHVGALLALNAQRLGGPQRIWSRLLLRNAFLLAPQTSAYAQATVRAVLTADALCEAPPEKGRQRPPWERRIGDAVAPFVAAQMRLLTQLGECGIQRQGLCQRAAQRLQALQGLDDGSGHAWDLLEPFIAHPEVAAMWLRVSFLAAPNELMDWVIAGVNARDKQALISLAAWTAIRGHYRNDNNDPVHDRVMKMVHTHCDQARIQDLMKCMCDARKELTTIP